MPDQLSRGDNLEFYHGTFEFLARVFLDVPELTFFERLVQANPFQNWPVKSDCPDLRRGLDLLDLFCTNWTPAQLGALKSDYTHLFLGLDKTLAPPYESVFLSEDHLLFERQTLEVRAFYSRHELKVREDERIPDDHLGYELQFVATLCQRLASSASSANPLLRDLVKFLDVHLLSWLPDLCDRVLTHGTTEFYKGMALVTNATVTDLRGDLGCL